MNAAPHQRRADAVVYSRAAVASDTVVADSRSVDVVASTDAIDSHGTILRQNWTLDRYRANPVVLYAHDSCELPIGTASNVRIEDGKLRATLTFSTADLNPQAEQVWLNVKAGVLRGISVGFWPHTVLFETHDDREVLVFDDLELLEISVVPIGSNPETLAEMRSRALKQRHHITYETGDRVQVIPGKEHMPGHAGVPATIEIVNGDTYGLLFDGTKEIHKWYVGDELELLSDEAEPPMRAAARSSSAPQPQPTPVPVAAVTHVPPTGKEEKSMSEKSEKSEPNQFVQAITIALGLPVGSTESDILARASNSHAFEKECTALAGASSNAEALGVVRGLKSETQRVKAMSAELELVRGERDRQNLDSLFAIGKSDRKLDKAMCDFYEAKFQAAAPEARGAVVEDLRGQLKVLHPVFPAQARQVQVGAGTTEQTWNGKTYAQLGPQERANLKSADPELSASMRRDWEAAGKPLAAIAG